MPNPLYFAFVPLCLMFDSCFSSLPTTTPGGGWFVQTNYLPEPGTGPLLVPAPNTTVTLRWQSDSQGAAGDPNEFVVTTDSVAAIAAVENGRAPATWNFQWNASTSFPQCDGVTASALVGPQRVEEFNCFYTYTVGTSPGFSFNPDPINIGNPPPTSSISGSGFSSQYGMPNFQ